MFCTNCGVALPEGARFCNQCGREVQPAGYQLLAGEFEHPSMQQMNQTLRRSVVLNRLAESLSRKVGKPWYESCFNSVETTERQYARVHELARTAARRIGFTHVPSVYIEADRGYQSNTYGSERDAFVNVGTFLPKLLNDRELLFILGHEFGHLKSHHALWMTVSLFLVGQARSNLMSEGLMGLVSNPLKIIESGVESVIMNWMRAADLTADRAALLVAGDIAVARRALFLLYFKSRKELEEVDVEEWSKEQEAQAASMVRFSQAMTSATPYLGLRLRALAEFYRSDRYSALRAKVESGSGLDLDSVFDAEGRLKGFAGPPARPGRKAGDGAPSGRNPAASPAGARVIAGRCPSCRARVRVPLGPLAGKAAADVTCAACGKVLRLDLARILGGRRPGPRPPEMKPAARKVRVARGECPKCGAAFALRLDALPSKP